MRQQETMNENAKIYQMRTQILNEWMAFNDQLGPGPLALGPGPRTQGNTQRTMNETAKRTMNETAKRTVNENAKKNE